MLTLAINTATSLTSIALLEEQKLLGEDSWKSNNDEAEKLMPAISNLFKKNKKDFSGIKKVIVIKGPGSFTGLRVGVTIANTIAYLNNCNLYAINTFQYWWSAAQELDPKTTALLIFAGHKGLYANRKGQDTAEIVNLFEINNYLSNKNILQIFGDITQEQKSEFKNIEFLEKKQTFGETISKYDLSSLKSTKIVKPLYIKPPSITKSKKKCFI